MLMTKQEYEGREDKIARTVELTLEDGRCANSEYEMVIHPDSYDVEVRELRTGMIVAYSSTKADFENSLVEFAEDYFA